MRLLVAFDGSDGAMAALREANALARAAGASVVLLRVLNPLVDAADVVAPSTAEAMRPVLEHAAVELGTAAEAAGLDPARTSREVMEQRHGEDAGDTIVRVAQEREATMIVIASRRVASVAGTVLGSVTREVLANAPCPVLVVRP